MFVRSFVRSFVSAYSSSFGRGTPPGISNTGILDPGHPAAQTSTPLAVFHHHLTEPDLVLYDDKYDYTVYIFCSKNMEKRIVKNAGPLSIRLLRPSSQSSTLAADTAAPARVTIQKKHCLSPL